MPRMLSNGLKMKKQTKKASLVKSDALKHKPIQ